MLNQGDKAVVIGEEGNGKSTLLKWIYDPELIEPYAEAAGERIAAGERLAYLPQELQKKDAAKTLYEFFAEDPSFFEQTPGSWGSLQAASICHRTSSTATSQWTACPAARR